MAQSGAGTAPAKEKTSAPGGTQSNAANGAATSPAVQQETVFDESTFVANATDSSLAVNSTAAKVQHASIRFFVVTGISLIEALFFSLSDVKVAVACGVVAVVFGALGALTYRLNRGAVLAGIAIYAAETALLLLHGWNTSMITVGYAVLVHCAIIYRLYLAYGMISDLQTAHA
ncbi:MAG TPA: hypothetical protein VE994_05890 [Terriglobales bacterium]|nr:hypothetical protein [Terriglobales bacterium]